MLSFFFVVNPFKNENELLSVSDVSAIFSVVLLVEQLDLQLSISFLLAFFFHTVSFSVFTTKECVRFKLKKYVTFTLFEPTFFGDLFQFWFKDSYSLGSTTVRVGWFMRLKFGWFYSLI